PTPSLPEVLLQEREGLTSQIRARLDAKGAHLDRGLWADAVELRDRQRRDKRLCLVGHDRELAVWLAIVRCDLGEELVAGNSGRGCKPDFVVDPRPDCLGGLPRGRDAFEIVGYVEIGLIEREGFDQPGVVLKDRTNLLGHSAVNVEPWGNK